MRQAAAEQLMDMIGRMPPEIGMMLLDLAVESMDLPNREEIAKRIRARTKCANRIRPGMNARGTAAGPGRSRARQAQKAMFMAGS